MKESPEIKSKFACDSNNWMTIYLFELDDEVDFAEEVELVLQMKQSLRGALTLLQSVGD